MSPRRAATFAILWCVVALSHTANVVGRTHASRAEPLFVAMEFLARLGVRTAHAG